MGNYHSGHFQVVQCRLNSVWRVLYLKDTIADEKQPRQFSWRQKTTWAGDGKQELFKYCKRDTVPFCSLDIFDITTGILCSAPPYETSTHTFQPQIIVLWQLKKKVNNTCSDFRGEEAPNQPGSKLPWCWGQTRQSSAAGSLQSSPGRDSVSGRKQGRSDAQRHCWRIIKDSQTVFTTRIKKKVNSTQWSDAPLQFSGELSADFHVGGDLLDASRVQQGFCFGIWEVSALRIAILLLYCLSFEYWLLRRH